MQRALLLAIGILFVLYPALRPWSDESLPDAAAASMGSPWWVATHLFAMIGFILLPTVPLVFRRTGTPGSRALASAAVMLWLGAGLVLPYYGAEAFALNAIAHQSAVDLLSLADAVRYGPAQGVMFLLGLLLIAAGAVLTAVGVARTHPWWLGVAFAAGFVLFAPQFVGPPFVRIAHGALIGIGCLLLAVAAPSRLRAASAS